MVLAYALPINTVDLQHTQTVFESHTVMFESQPGGTTLTALETLPPRKAIVYGL